MHKSMIPLAAGRPDVSFLESMAMGNPDLLGYLYLCGAAVSVNKRGAGFGSAGGIVGMEVPEAEVGAVCVVVAGECGGKGTIRNDCVAFTVFGMAEEVDVSPVVVVEAAGGIIDDVAKYCDIGSGEGIKMSVGRDI